jgi:Tuftelin interacting protein N terminal
MSDDEVEKFEVTDYDLFNEFNMNRPRHRLSKNKQIYGKFIHTHALLKSKPIVFILGDRFFRYLGGGQ